MNSLNTSPDDTLRLRKEAQDWFVRRRDAGWSAQDESAFRQWLDAAARHADAYERCVAQWSRLDGMPADLVARMRGQLAHEKQQLQAQPSFFSSSRRRFLAWPAATATVAAAGGMGYVFWRQLQMQPLYQQAFNTVQGQVLTIQLPDQSSLWLDTATRLEVSFYQQRREVRLLDGQAVFQVQADGRPFHVLAGPMRVTVVGTRFSVRYTPGLPGNDGVRVAVEEGRVRVVRLSPAGTPENDDAQSGVLLVAGQQVGADPLGKLGHVSTVPADGIAPWRDQRISFVDVPLSQALAELERYHKTGLVVRDPKVAALRLSGTFGPMDTSLLRRALPRILPVQLQDRDGQTEVVAKN